jgi:hypothetical protein
MILMAKVRSTGPLRVAPPMNSSPQEPDPLSAPIAVVESMEVPSPFTIASPTRRARPCCRWQQLLRAFSSAKVNCCEPKPRRHRRHDDTDCHRHSATMEMVSLSMASDAIGCSGTGSLLERDTAAGGDLPRGSSTELHHHTPFAARFCVLGSQALNAQKVPGALSLATCGRPSPDQRRGSRNSPKRQDDRASDCLAVQSPCARARRIRDAPTTGVAYAPGAGVCRVDTSAGLE